MNILEVSQLKRAFPAPKGWSDALSGVDLGLEQGEVVGLLGRNGAGKTTLIDLIMGIYPPDAGSVRVFGLDPREHPVEVKRRVGYVSEKQILPELLSLTRLVDFHREVFPTWDDEFAAELIANFDLQPEKRIGTMSKGQARKAALVCAIAHRPELLLLDEPAAGLDPAARREFLETTIRLLGSDAPTVLFSSHHMNDVERLAQRVVILDEGRVLLDNSIDALREDFTLAILDQNSGLAEGDLQRLDGCLGVREHGGQLRAIFGHQPTRTSELLVERLGRDGAQCETLPLEELFVELVGGTR